MTLYEITDDIKALDALIESSFLDEDGNAREPTDQESADILEMIGETEGAFRAKVENVCKYRANLLADAVAFKAEEDRLAKRRKTLERKTDALKMYLDVAMHNIGQDKVDAGIFRLRLQKNTPKVDIINMDMLETKYIRIIPETREANKVEIKKDFDIGAYPWGAITQGKSLRIE